MLRGCEGLQRTHFEQFPLWDGVVVLKEMILNSFYFGMAWWSWKNWFLSVSTLIGCGGLERTHFNSFYVKRVWGSSKNSFWTVSTLGWCCGPERNDFEQFPLWDGVVVLKELILNSFYFGMVWQVLKELIFLSVSTLVGCGGLERTHFEQFLYWDGVVVLKKLILTVSMLRGCEGFQRTHFELFPLWDGVVVLKEMIFISFHFGRGWWSWKNWFLTVSTLGGCGGLKRTRF